ncbi:MAG: phosphoribosylamine--glycine ligase [Clostridiaceae bacterium]
MKVLILGNGGREHAIAWKVAQSPKVTEVFVAPGNGGTAIENKCKNVDLKTIEEFVSFAKENKVDLTIVGPEVYLCDGVVDAFKKEGLKAFGPAKLAATLEGSKSFAKDFMKKYDIKTAAYEVFEEVEPAVEYLKTAPIPTVIKADGLAAGKGVVIAQTREEAIDTVKSFIIDDVFKGAGKKIVIEEFLDGVEASILSITDGKTIIPFISQKDHKKIFEGETGPNTGGMGVIAPNPYFTEEVNKEFVEKIMEPTVKGFIAENFDYTGIVFFGVMITKNGAYLLEYNVRMGDPETQAVLPIMESDFVEVIEKALDGKLNEVELKWKDSASCCVTAASKGYPASYETGFEITGTNDTDAKVFIAGAVEKDGKLLTSGGRVLNVVALGDTLEAAREKAYAEIQKVNFDGIYFRKDIGVIK